LRTTIGMLTFPVAYSTPAEAPSSWPARQAGVPGGTGIGGRGMAGGVGAVG
jgi:hypothetical protein